MIKINLQYFGGNGASSGKAIKNGGGAKWPDNAVNRYIDSKFPGMNAHEVTNKYWTMDRISKDGNTIIVKVNGDTHIQETRYGYALLLDQNNVVFLKTKDVSDNFYGTEVRLSKENFKVSKWGDWSNKGLLGENKDSHNFSDWKKTAKLQQKAGNKVNWEKTAGEKTIGSFQKQAEKKKKRKEEGY